MLRVGDALRAEDLQKAHEVFSEIIEQSPDYLPAYAELGCLSNDLGDYDQAIIFWGVAVELGVACIPKEFLWEQDKIPWHFPDNRPFLSALENLGRAQLRQALGSFRYFAKLTSGHHQTSEIVAFLEANALAE